MCDLFGLRFTPQTIRVVATARGEPAWHRRARKQRSTDRVVVHLAKAAARLDKHHGSSAGMLAGYGPELVADIVRGVVDVMSGGDGGAGGAAGGVVGQAVWGGKGEGNGGKGAGKGKGGKGARPFLPGDWACQAALPEGGHCGFHNFASRGVCYRCGAVWAPVGVEVGRGGGKGCGGGQGGWHGGVATQLVGAGGSKGPVGANGNKPMLSWGSGGRDGGSKANVGIAGGNRGAGNYGSKKGPKVAKDENGYTSMLRSGKPQVVGTAAKGGVRDDYEGGSESQSEDDSMLEGKGEYEDAGENLGEWADADGEEDEWDEHGENEEGGEGEEDHEILRQEWETAVAELGEARKVLSKGNPMLKTGEDKVRETYSKWKEVRPERPLEKRMLYQRQKMEKNTAKLRKREAELEELKAEVLPKLEESERRVNTAREWVRKDEAEWSQLLQEERNERGKDGKDDEAGKMVGEALEKVLEIGPKLAAIAENTADSDPTKCEINLVLQELHNLMQNLRRVEEVPGGTKVYDMADDDGEPLEGGGG